MSIIFDFIGNLTRILNHGVNRHGANGHGVNGHRVNGRGVNRRGVNGRGTRMTGVITVLVKMALRYKDGNRLWKDIDL
jgi:hypothetical protein